MTENENLKKQITDDLSAVLKEAKSMGCKEVACFRHIPLKNVETVIQALEEIQQYRAIGTIEEFKALKDCGTHDCIIKHLSGECSYKETGCSDCKSKWKIKDLLEKSVAKKPIPLDKWGEYHECPVCGKYAENNYGCKYLYCPNCGCKYDWSE